MTVVIFLLPVPLFTTQPALSVFGRRALVLSLGSTRATELADDDVAERVRHDVRQIIKISKSIIFYHGHCLQVVRKFSY